MGGVLGIVTAAQPKNAGRAIVVNDVGPMIEPAALARIADYFGRIRRSRRSRKSKRTCARFRHRSARSPTSNGPM